MTYSHTQLAAIEQATLILAAAGLSLSDLPDLHTLDPGDDPPYPPTLHDLQSCNLSSSVLSSSYEPPRARMFTLDELHDHIPGSRLNRQASVNGIVDHPLGAIVEYPETGAQLGECIAHRFAVDPHNFLNPKENLQYSLGDEHGGHKAAQCFLLADRNGKPVLCSHLHTSCESYKIICHAATLTDQLPRQRTEDMFVLPPHGGAKPQLHFAFSSTFASFSKSACEHSCRRGLHEDTCILLCLVRPRLQV